MVQNAMTQTFAGPEAYRIRPPGAQRPVRIRRIVPGNSPEERLLFLLAGIDPEAEPSQ